MVLTFTKVNQLICQNHEEDFFQILSVSQKVRTLATTKLETVEFKEKFYFRIEFTPEFD